MQTQQKRKKKATAEHTAERRAEGANEVGTKGAQHSENAGKGRQA